MKLYKNEIYEPNDDNDCETNDDYRRKYSGILLREKI